VSRLHRTTGRAATRATDSGFTLVEGLVAMVVFVTAISVMASATAAMTQNMRHAQGVSLATDQTRLGFNRLDKQVRYATAITTPGPGLDGTGWYVEFSLEDARRDGRTANNAFKDTACHQWRVLDGKLETRNWRVNPAGHPIGGTPRWLTVATGLVNDRADVNRRPFAVLPVEPGVREHQELTVDLSAQRDPRRGGVQLKAAFLARNTNSGSVSTGRCDRGRS